MSDLPDILVLGLGSSGASAARYCARRLATEFGSVTALDAADSPRLQAVAAELAVLGVQVELGTSTVTGAFDLCIASPGIAPHAPIMRAAVSASVRVISEIEFAYERSECAWVAVTGTNGKTTTTALVAHLLAMGGFSARAVGNIGAPAIEAVGDASPAEVLVAEVSSFQLALTERFHPRVAVLLNVTPDHLDWHGSYERYAQDKAKVFANLGPDDVAVIDADDPGASVYLEPVAATGTRVIAVSQVAGPGRACVVEGTLTVPARDGSPVALARVDDLKIKGPHNVGNALAAAATAHELGVSAGDLIRGLTTFEPIEHRLEPAGTVAGVEWFNDSKATNPDAVSKALGAFGDRPLVLLLGGRNKGNDFGPLALEAAGKARAAVLFGEAAPDLARAFDATATPVTRVSTLAEAVSAAAAIAEPGDAVVLSPACASFDEFSNFEERGRVFKSLVARLASEAAS
jgi:UDP-N-acetylmuramoylalanine--D-glutamate ligase